VSPDQVVRIALKLGRDRLKHLLGVIAAPALNFIEMAAIDSDGFCELGLCETPMSPPFPNEVPGSGAGLIHFALAPHVRIAETSQLTRTLAASQASRAARRPRKRSAERNNARPTSRTKTGRSVAAHPGIEHGNREVR
jgi:hypothetical protein